MIDLVFESDDAALLAATPAAYVPEINIIRYFIAAG
jgi:hypothetical protein